MIKGVFTVAQKLYDLRFQEVDDIESYHKDVKTYRVYDNEGRLVSIFYADFHPRAGKRGGAWMTSYKPQQIKNGINDRPHVSIVCNFTKPTRIHLNTRTPSAFLWSFCRLGVTCFCGCLLWFFVGRCCCRCCCFLC